MSHSLLFIYLFINYLYIKLLFGSRSSREKESIYVVLLLALGSIWSIDEYI